jgi:hypothetical protein
MGNYINQFNDTASAILQLAPNSEFQHLVFENRGRQFKNLTAITANAFPLLAAPWDEASRCMNRLVVCSGQLGFDVAKNPVPQVLVNNLNLPTGYNRVYLDVTFINTFSIIYNTPLQIPEDETLNVILGLPWIEDEVYGLNPAYAYLSVNGYDSPEPLNKQGNFPYVLR